MSTGRGSAKKKRAAKPEFAAVIPAAGLSARMGRPKLLLPIGGEPLIGRVVRAFHEGGAHPIVVVTPPQSQPECDAILQAIERFSAMAIIPDHQPPDMRASVEFAVGAMVDGPFLLAPGDSPAITADLVRLMIQEHATKPDQILIPAYKGKRGHPIVIPADLIPAIFNLPENVGLNTLIAQSAHRVTEIPVDDPTLTDDLDTPEDYQRWTGSDLPQD